MEVADFTNQLILGDALDQLKQFPDSCIDMIITSPPYWGLRDYRVEGQIGLEPTINEFVDKMVAVFTECKRVLTDHGTLWINFGDTYYSGSGTRTLSPDRKVTKNGYEEIYPDGQKVESDVKRKSMCLVPERIAVKLVDDGWILRNKVIWCKPNCVPHSVKDRFTHDWEYIYFFSKKANYYFEQQFEPVKSGTPRADYDLQRMIEGRKVYAKGKHDGSGLQKPFVAGSFPKMHGPVDGKKYDWHQSNSGKSFPVRPMRNKRAVWTIPPLSVKESHFATFPPKLIEVPIRAGCPEFVCKKCGAPKRKVILKSSVEDAFNIRVRDVQKGRIKDSGRVASEEEVLNYNEKDYQIPEKELVISKGCDCNAGFRKGIVMDLFMGSGTTAIVARALDRDFVGIELNPEYIEMAYGRLEKWPKERVLKHLKGESAPEPSNRVVYSKTLDWEVPMVGGLDCQ